MEFLKEYHLLGLLIGISTFLIIGLFHPVVIKAEYYLGTRVWWLFMLLGVLGVIGSLIIRKYFDFGSSWSIFFFIFLDYQRDIRTRRTGTKRMVSQKSEKNLPLG